MNVYSLQPLLGRIVATCMYIYDDVKVNLILLTSSVKTVPKTLTQHLVLLYYGLQASSSNSIPSHHAAANVELWMHLMILTSSRYPSLLTDVSSSPNILLPGRVMSGLQYMEAKASAKDLRIWFYLVTFDRIWPVFKQLQIVNKKITRSWIVYFFCLAAFDSLLYKPGRLTFGFSQFFYSLFYTFFLV